MSGRLNHQRVASKLHTSDIASPSLQAPSERMLGQLQSGWPESAGNHTAGPQTGGPKNGEPQQANACRTLKGGPENLRTPDCKPSGNKLVPIRPRPCVFGVSLQPIDLVSSAKQILGPASSAKDFRENQLIRTGSARKIFAELTGPIDSRTKKWTT